MYMFSKTIIPLYISYKPKYFICTIPTKMCIKFASYLHQTSGNSASKIMLFLGALVIMMLTHFVPNSIRRCSSGNILKNDDAKFALNIMQIFPK